MSGDLLNIIFADDDFDELEFLQLALSDVMPGTTLTTATDGTQLMDLLDNVSIPDAIVLDLNMPKKNGFQCLKEIRSNPDFSNVPVIVLTTSSSPLDTRNCLESGANLYLLKPESFNGMRLVAQQICDQVRH